MSFCKGCVYVYHSLGPRVGSSLHVCFATGDEMTSLAFQWCLRCFSLMSFCSVLTLHALPVLLHELSYRIDYRSGQVFDMSIFRTSQRSLKRLLSSSDGAVNTPNNLGSRVDYPMFEICSVINRRTSENFLGFGNEALS